MGLLTMEGDALVIKPELLTLKPFNDMWFHHSDREIVMKELAYIYFMEDLSSPFRQYEDNRITKTSETGETIRELSLRQSRVLAAVFDAKDLFHGCWEESDHLVEARRVYRELHRTYSMNLLESAEMAVHKLQEYFEDVDLLETTDNGVIKYKASDLIANLKNVGYVIQGIKQLKEEVEKETSELVRVRGGSKVDKNWETPKKHE